MIVYLPRMLRAAGALVLALTMGAILSPQPAHAAQGPDSPITVTQATCEDGGEVTVSISDHPYHVSSETRTAGLSVRADGEVFYTEPMPMANGEHLANESITVGPFGSTTLVEYRWFAGPDRGDLPVWDASGPSDEGWDDAVAEIEALEADTGRPWNAGDTAEFIPWYEYEAEGCTEPTADPIVVFKDICDGTKVHLANGEDAELDAEFAIGVRGQPRLQLDPVPPGNTPDPILVSATTIAVTERVTNDAWPHTWKRPEDCPEAPGAGGSLPETGSAALKYGAGGALGLALGAFLVLAVRRRRVTFAA